MNTPNIYQEGSNEIIRSDYEKYLESLNKEDLQKIIDYLNNKERSRDGISNGENIVFEEATFIINSKNGGRHRSTKSSKKHPTARRHRRSSKARKSRKSRATRRK